MNSLLEDVRMLHCAWEGCYGSHPYNLGRQQLWLSTLSLRRFLHVPGLCRLVHSNMGVNGLCEMDWQMVVLTEDRSDIEPRRFKMSIVCYL